MTDFFFVRHGVTAHTGQKLSGRMPDILLTEEGTRQADVVAESLADVPFKAIYSSPIERTMETARAIARYHKLEVKVRRGVTEVEFGRWSDRSFKMLRRTKLWRTVQTWPSGARFPDGESLVQVRDRAVEEVERLRAEHPRQTICCVSHADVIKLIAAHYLGMHMDLYQRLVIGPASISVISVTDAGPRVGILNAPSTTRFGKK
jgi:probable phosphomutase (TIGR03848 family)